jgi:hypothetical protein
MVVTVVMVVTVAIEREQGVVPAVLAQGGHRERAGAGEDAGLHAAGERIGGGQEAAIDSARRARQQRDDGQTLPRNAAARRFRHAITPCRTGRS